MDSLPPDGAASGRAAIPVTGGDNEAEVSRLLDDVRVFVRGW